MLPKVEFKDYTWVDISLPKAGGMIKHRFHCYDYSFRVHRDTGGTAYFIATHFENPKKNIEMILSSLEARFLAWKFN
jgi:hypothetical protein